jgi:hypothetical protein
VTLTGDNFGPTGTPLRAFYRNAFGTMYTAVGCAVTSPSVQMTCLNVPGVGPSVAWLVEVGGRNGTGFSTVVNTYTSPSLISVASTQAMDTRGGASHTVSQ